MLLHARIEANCASDLAIAAEVEPGVIRLLEVNTGLQNARCNCIYDLEVVLAGIEAGPYDLQLQFGDGQAGVIGELELSAESTGALIINEAPAMACE